MYPGEEFSAYEVVAPFTAENGYAMAGSYLNGETVDSMGGGICQVSTTLYNAVLRAELEVTERSPHSMTVSYVELSEADWREFDRLLQGIEIYGERYAPEMLRMTGR